MSLRNDEIKDDEIRIISPRPASPSPKKNQKRKHWIPILAGALIIAAIIGAVAFFNAESDEETVETPVTPAPSSQEALAPAAELTGPGSSITVIDTVINRKGLRIFEPRNATPALVLGNDFISDSTIILATRAADIREDNGQILGTFVLNGDLKSQGESKAGFCAIVNGELSLGVADSTPLLEKALTEGGYFFRQYPLVVGGQAIENKPKNTAIRKALAQWDNKVCIIVSREKLSFNEFSQLLTDAGVRNAIYLCGGDSFGFYTDEKGARRQINVNEHEITPNHSFIIWR